MNKLKYEQREAWREGMEPKEFIARMATEGMNFAEPRSLVALEDAMVGDGTQAMPEEHRHVLHSHRPSSRKRRDLVEDDDLNPEDITVVSERVDFDLDELPSQLGKP